MGAAPIPANEVARLRALESYAILDTAPEEEFDALTELAAHVCDAPMSLITLVDGDRQWFKSRVGFALEETSRDTAFCAYPVADGRFLEVEDALADDRFAGNPYVLDDPHIRFYAGAPLTTEDGHTLGTVCVLDRSPRKLTDEQRAALSALARAAMAQLDLHRQNARLREVDRMKEEFVAVVSHELRTPLSSIVGYVEELLAEAAGPLSDLQRTFLGVVDRNAARLLTLVNDLLFIAQVEAGSVALDAASADLAEVAAEAVETARITAEQKGLTLQLERDGAVLVRGDRRRLGQVADNLLSNAVKFTPEGGTVRVAVERGSNEAALVVQDSGMGIAADELPHLFERFYRTAAAAGSAAPGSGLGLAIARAIVDAHEGVVEVESEPGRGTTFRVRLPLEATGFSG